MNLRKIPFVILVVVSLNFVLFGPAAAGADRTCESLSSLTLSHTKITLAQTVPSGTLSIPVLPEAQKQAMKDLPAFCRIAATLTPTTDSDIKVEIWLPLSNWNEKFQAVGNGGWAGSINYQDMAKALRRGYATSSTDTGHSGDGGSFAQNWEKYVDFAYRSEHEMTVQAKAIINFYYDRLPQYSYWNGCSTGGRQGLAEAQRFPDDYDGIIAGAPANPKTYLNAWALNIAQTALKDPASYIPPSQYPLIHNAVINACDSLDGVKDGLIENPMQCRFDPKVLECKGTDQASCLTPKQVELVRSMTAPAKTKDGREIFPGYDPGNELGWNGRIGGPEPPDTAVDQYKYVVHKDPKWDWRTFQLDKDVALSDEVDKGTINSTDPDLGKFGSHNGKLILYHGWSDQNVAARSTVNYYNSVVDTMGGSTATSNLLRLFMVPGMGHCGGGEGPNTFDMVTPLEQWVEHDVAPGRIVASHGTNGKVDRTRPLCPFPQVAHYNGTGSIDEAANFTCQIP